MDMTWVLTAACALSLQVWCTHSNKLRRGYRQFSAGDFPGAVRLLSQAVQAQPGNAQARCYLAHALLNCGAASAAVEQFEAAGFIKPLSANDLCALGNAYAQVGSLPKSTAVYQQAIRKDRNLSDAWVGLTKAYAQLQQQQLAQSVYRRGLAVNQDVIELPLGKMAA